MLTSTGSLLSRFESWKKTANRLNERPEKYFLWILNEIRSDRIVTNWYTMSSSFIVTVRSHYIPSSNIIKPNNDGNDFHTTEKSIVATVICYSFLF